jgi:hypothetical protein
MTDPTSPIFTRLFRKVEIVRNDMKASGNNRYHDLDEILSLVQSLKKHLDNKDE